MERVIGFNRLPSLDDRNDLHYTNAFLHETMRWVAFVPLGVIHFSTDEIVLKDYKIPKGKIRKL